MEAQDNVEVWSLEDTPTWAVATVCTIFITISLLVVTAVEKIERHLEHAHRKPLVRALHRIKEEVMLMGFISLLLTMFKNHVLSLCVKSNVLKDWTPCHYENKGPHAPTSRTEGRTEVFQWRIRSQSDPREACESGHSPIVSSETLHQLHTVIFALAVVHVIYSLFVMLLASTKVNRWKVWEEKLHQGKGDDLGEVVQSLSLNRQTTFIKYHTSQPWSRNRFFGWMVCFFRQFGKSVVRSDYLALRLGFIRNHNTGRSFDFHSYVVRSLEDEYQKVVGISVPLWFFVILYMLFNAVGTNLFFWLSIVPPVLLLLVGAKLQSVIATLALESAGCNGIHARTGTTFRPRDELFWFKKPDLILTVVHYILFQNAFEMATFLSFAWLFGLNSCLLRNKLYVYTRIAIGVIVQITCSYSTLPLYALVSHMGSDYKQAIFQDHVRDKLRHWTLGAKRTVRNGTQGGSTASHHNKSSIHSNSPDELGLETILASGNDPSDPRLQLISGGHGLELVEQSKSDPQDRQSTVEISIGNDNDCQPFLIPAFPPQMPCFTRANSEIRAPTQAISNKFYKQLSSNALGGGSVSVQLQPDETIRTSAPHF